MARVPSMYIKFPLPHSTIKGLKHCPIFQGRVGGKWEGKKASPRK